MQSKASAGDEGSQQERSFSSWGPCTHERHLTQELELLPLQSRALLFVFLPFGLRGDCEHNTRGLATSLLILLLKWVTRPELVQTVCADPCLGLTQRRI